MLREGVTIETSPDNYKAFSSARLIRFDGTKWITFDEPVQLKQVQSR